MPKLPKFFGVKNFEKYQHYTDRRPPWIKLYYTLLDDYAFMMLTEVEQSRYMKLMLVASQCDNRISTDQKYIKSVLRISDTGDVDLRPLFSAGFLVPWTKDHPHIKVNMWASRYIPEHIKTQVLDRGICVECGADGRTNKLEVDHIQPISQGGTQDISNLQCLCRSCNRKKRNRIDARQMLDQCKTDAIAEKNKSQSKRREEKNPPNPLTGVPAVEVNFSRQAEEVIQFLNEKTGRHYRLREGPTAHGKLSANTERIVARLKSGATVMQCRQIIAMKAREWRTDEKMAKFLRPATLFAKEKFEQYLGELGQGRGHEEVT